MTAQVAVKLPSAVVTVMAALPFATAVTTPLASTVATPGASELQLTVWFVAVAGATVAVRLDVPPGFSVRVVRFRVTPVTGVLTVTAQVAVLPPSAVVTVMVALPFATAVTLPVWSTVATLGALELQLTVWFVAVDGCTVAVRFRVAPGFSVRVVGFRETPVTGVRTVTAQVAVWPPSVVLTVMVALPFATAVTTPFASTLATPSSLEVQLTVWFVAVAGCTVAVRLPVPPGFSVRVVGATLTDVTGTVTVSAASSDVTLP